MPTHDEILNEYPEAKPFADLIVADTQEDLREMAKLISERVQAHRHARAAASPEPPAGAIDGDHRPRNPASAETKPLSVAEAIKKRDWGAYLAAKHVEQGL